MQMDFISLKKQIIFGCIPIIGGLVVLGISFINFTRIPKVLEKLLFGLGFFLIGAGLFGLWMLLLNIRTEDFSTITAVLGLFIFYYIAFAFILCQFLLFKITERRSIENK